MKPLSIAFTLVAASCFFLGCDSKTRGPAHGQQNEFRRQITDSIPVKQWGYTISDLRVSRDGEKVLVVFGLPGGTNGVKELILTNDGFRKFRGNIYDETARKSAKRDHWAEAELRRSNQWARMETERSNMMVRAQAGARPFVPATPPDDDAPSFNYLQAGSAAVVVTLPEQ